MPFVKGSKTSKSLSATSTTAPVVSGAANKTMVSKLAPKTTKNIQSKSSAGISKMTGAGTNLKKSPLKPMPDKGTTKGSYTRLAKGGKISVRRSK